jgi:hypothetical protein
MAKKLVGRKGRELAESAVTGEGGRTLPKTRTTRKQESAIYTLLALLMVEVDGNNPKDLYRILRYFRYKWTGEVWTQQYPKWLEIVGSKGPRYVVKVN